jgi:hypothetical protein
MHFCPFASSPALVRVLACFVYFCVFIVSGSDATTVTNAKIIKIGLNSTTHTFVQDGYLFAAVMP